MRSLLTLGALAVSLHSLASAQSNLAPTPSEPVITVAGQSFYTWQEYYNSPLFLQMQMRCSTPSAMGSTFMSVPGDCNLSRTRVLPEYEPGNLPVITIDVVVHVIMNSAGTQGNLSDALIHSQIDILNEDFGAIPGTPGAPGAETGIRFRLATVDPQGNPTNGITRSMNTTWYNDGGSYWNALAWDTSRYMNIYTNNASGALGYVPCLPQCGGLVGNDSDRVVCLWSAFGRNSPGGPPYNQGRTATHEVGHYLGLEHTFSGGCASASSCSTNGDLICDTNPESSPTFGCPGNRFTCGLQAPFHNYMDYSNDTCMWEFTEDQANRMRCTLVNWRPDLGETCGVVASALGRTGNNPNVYFANPPTLGGDVTFNVIEPNYNFATLFAYRGSANIPLANGQSLLIDLGSPFVFSANIPGLPFASFTQTVPNNSALCGTTLYTQVILTGPQSGGLPGYQLTNAVDLSPGTP